MFGIRSYRAFGKLIRVDVWKRRGRARRNVSRKMVERGEEICALARRVGVVEDMNLLILPPTAVWDALPQTAVLFVPDTEAGMPRKSTEPASASGRTPAVVPDE